MSISETDKTRLRELVARLANPDHKPESEEFADLLDGVNTLLEAVGEAEQDAADEKHDKDILMKVLGSSQRRVFELENRCEKLMDQLEKAARVEAFETAINMLRAVATDPGAAKNYVQCELTWEHALGPNLPFKRACIAFVRDGAKNPAELVREALVAKAEAVEIALGLLDDLEDSVGAGAVGSAAETRRRLSELLITPEANHPPLPGTKG